MGNYKNNAPCGTISSFNTRFFIKAKLFISNTRLYLAKNQAEAKQHPETELLLFENYSVSSFMLLSTIKNVQKQVCVYRFICMYLFI